MDSIRSKIGLQFIVSNGSIAAHFALSIVLARLLTPSEIGIFSITAVFVGFTQVFRDFGVVAFIKRQKTLTPELLRSASGVLFTSSWVIALLLYLSTDLWAAFFKQPGIHEIMPVLALGFVFIPFGSIPQAVLAREMEVRKTTLVTGISTLVYISTCITLASMGFSYMSMAWSNLASIIVSGVALSLMMPKELRVSPSLKGWGRVVSFGAGAMLTSSLKALDNALPDTLLGKLSGPYDVGIFSRANSTVNILNTVTGPTVNYFALPYLAQVHHGGRKLNNELTRTVAYLTCIMWPALVVTGVMADDIIMLLYGVAWRESAAAVPWLCLTSGIQITFAIMQPAMTAVGRPYVSATPLALTLSAKCLAALLFYDGTLVSYARAVALAECVSIPVYIWISTRYLGMAIADWFRSTRASLAVAAVILLQILLCDRLFAVIVSPFWSLVVAAAWLIPGWTLTVIYLRHPLGQEIEKIASRIRSRRRSSELTTQYPSGPRVVIYGAVADVPSPRSSFGKLFTSLKHSMRIEYDLLCWRQGSLTHLNYRSYVTPWTVNRGDQAIALAVRRALASVRSDINFYAANWGDRRLLKTKAKEIDMLVVSGGGYILFDRNGRLAERVEVDVRALLRSQAIVVLFGVGVNRLLEAKNGHSPAISAEDGAALRQLLERASLISVRDRNSRDELAAFTTKPIHIIGDPALFLHRGRGNTSPDSARRKGDGPMIGVSFPFHGPAANQRITEDFPAYIDMLKQLQKLTRCSFKYIVHFGSEVVLAKMAIQSGVQMQIIIGEPDELCDAYAGLNIHLGGMLHSCILAASAGTPSVGLAYDVKHAGFFEQLGLERYCIPILPFDGAAIVSAAQSALANEDKLRATIKAARERLEVRTKAFISECEEALAKSQVQST